MSSLGRPSGGLGVHRVGRHGAQFGCFTGGNRCCYGRNARAADALDALRRTDDLHGWIGRGNAPNGLGASVVAVVVGQEHKIRVQRRFVQRRAGVDEAVGWPLVGVVGIDLDDGSLRVLEAKRALAKPVDADCVFGYYERFKWVHGFSLGCNPVCGP